MPAATASGADHKQGNQNGNFTVQQKEQVLRILKCNATAYYQILELQKSCSEIDIKKAYRKLSLLTHPDKNGYKGADEAFKMVSEAFSKLSDPDLRKRHDQFGGDPTDRFAGMGGGGGGRSQSTSSGNNFTPRQPSGGNPFAGRPMGADFAGMSPEEMFNSFFGSPFGAAAMGGAFDAGPGVYFNMGGGGPGIRVHQFAGPRVRRRPAQGPAEPQSILNLLITIAPLFILFILPLLSTIFGTNDTSLPTFRFDEPAPPHTAHRTTQRYHLDYWVDPVAIADYSQNKLHNMDEKAETTFLQQLNARCSREIEEQNQARYEAYGFFGVNQEKFDRAEAMRKPACEKMEELDARRKEAYYNSRKP